jgi:hypothetical protein
VLGPTKDQCRGHHQSLPLGPIPQRYGGQQNIKQRRGQALANALNNVGANQYQYNLPASATPAHHSSSALANHQLVYHHSSHHVYQPATISQPVHHISQSVHQPAHHVYNSQPSVAVSMRTRSVKYSTSTTSHSPPASVVYQLVPPLTSSVSNYAAPCISLDSTVHCNKD